MSKGRCWTSVALFAQDTVVDSARWSEFPFRKDDIVIDTFGKTGTTWVQQIVGQLIFQGADDVQIGAISPWVEYRAVPWHVILELLLRQEHRRFVKSHLPRPALPYRRDAFYIYVARDARDQIWSIHNHLTNLKPSALVSNSGAIDVRDVRSLDIRQYYNELMDSEGSNVWPYWAHVLSWWRSRHFENVLLVHFSDLKADLRAETKRIADFLRIDVSEGVMQKIVEHSDFVYMKRNAGNFAGPGANAFKNGASILLNKGTNQRWRSVLTDEEIAKCDKAAARHLPPDCARWLKYGRSSGVLSESQSRRGRNGTAARVRRKLPPSGVK